MTLLSLDNIPALQDEVRALAAERGAVILAHNYQLPEIQQVADYVGDSLGLSQWAAASDADAIAFCGVHFMAETASILCPEKTVLLPDPDAGCSLADSITAPQLRAWKAKHPGAIVVMYVNTSAEVKAETDYCVTSSNAVAVVEHIYREHGEDTEILFGPDMFLGAFVEKRTGKAMRVWDGECHVHAGIRPSDIADMRAAHPGADFLIHPECGCSTSVMEYVAAGDVDPEGVHMLSTGGMLHYAQGAQPGRDRDRGDRGRDAPRPAPGGARRRLHRRQRGGELPLHEDDHAAEAARRAARRRAGGQGAAGDRGAGAHRDRADGRDRLAPASLTRDHDRAGAVIAVRTRGRNGRSEPLPEPEESASSRRDSSISAGSGVLVIGGSGSAAASSSGPPPEWPLPWSGSGALGPWWPPVPPEPAELLPLEPPPPESPRPEPSATRVSATRVSATTAVVAARVIAVGLVPRLRLIATVAAVGGGPPSGPRAAGRGRGCAAACRPAAPGATPSRTPP